ncbi:MAG: hypothetical protein H7Y15_09565 [Pseudonocardia sp.]|nr:hypothetical protein [Pseudonocardia sp.]
MSPATLRLDYDERAMARLRERVEGMRTRAQDASPDWEVVLDWFADRNFAQFLSRGAEYRTPWTPLAPSTVAQKRRLGFPRDPLVRTARLVHSITLRPLAVERIGPREFEAGTDVAYARFHQGGTRAGLPARPLFSAAEIKASNAVTYALANWVIDGVRSVRPRKRR